MRTRLGRRDTFVRWVREANATLDPAGVAERLVQEAAGWVPSPCWAVVVRDASGSLATLAHRGLTPGLDTGCRSAAEWVMRQSALFVSADLSGDSRAAVGAVGTAVGLPLACRGRTIGALLALDPKPSVAVPAIGSSLQAVLREHLEPAALALDNALAVQQAEVLAVIDDLTRLYNSRYLHQSLRREIKLAVRHERPVSLLFLDLDGFKDVNDTYGHMAGSRTLVEVGAILRGCARETDVVARFGGDEFAFVLPETGSQGALAVAARVRERLTGARFLAADGASLHLSASIGVATLPDVADTAEDLLRAADQAMYRVKASGKNGIHAARPEPRPPTPGALDSRS